MVYFEQMKKTHQRTSIVILGGGFAGLAAALELERRRASRAFNVTLIDKNCYHLYHALLYEIATAAVDITEQDLLALQSGVCIRIKALQDIFLKKNIYVLQDAVTSIDVTKNRVKVAQGGEVRYDELVVALGSQSNDFHIPGLAEHSVSLKELPDALAIHLRIDQLLRTVRPGEVKKILIGGAGVSGVEVAGELRHYILRLGREGRLVPQQFEVHLLEAGPTILPGLSAWAQAQALRRLQSLGVVVTTGRPIIGVGPRQVILKDGTTQGFDLLVWSGGIQGHAVLATMGLPLIGKRQIGVSDALTVPGHDHVSVVGDSMFFLDHATERPVPQVAPAAVAQGRLVARNIVARMDGRPLQPYIPVQSGYVFPIGGRWAVSTIGFRASGFVGWMMRKFVDLRYFFSIVSFRNAFRVWYRGGRAYLRND